MCYSSLNRRFSLLLASICLAGLSYSFIEVNASVAAPVQLAQAKKRQVTFRPRKGQPAPKTTLGGGRRQRGVCSQDLKNSANPQLTRMRLLVPTDVSATTVAEHPTLMVQLPETSARAVEVALLDAKGNSFYQKTVSLDEVKTPTVLRLELNDEEAKLEVDKDYAWMVTLVCSADGAQLGDPFVVGSIRRISSEPGLTQQLETTTDPLDRVALYAESGIWYEAIAELDALRREKPNDSEIKAAWNDLLASVGLDAQLATARH